MAYNTHIKKNKKIAVSIVVVLFFLWLIVTNIVVGVTTIEVSYEELPEAFDGYRIVQLSDLHNAEYGSKNKSLVDKIKKVNPDMIAITGDLIDSSATNIDIAIAFTAELTKIAPCYYVTGNHEAWVDDNTYRALEQGLMEKGVTILRDSEVLLEQDDAVISLIGIDDPEFAHKNNGIAKNMVVDEINKLSSVNHFSILLSHRPEYYNVYKRTDVNLVLAGHAHGGQFRLPFIGGIIAPNQGLFPQYDSGLYQEDEFAMVVSRGTGNSVIPIRFNNQPEIIVIDLLKE